MAYRVTVGWVWIPPEEAAARSARVLKILADSIMGKQVAELMQTLRAAAGDAGPHMARPMMLTWP
jgi:hypothetical protein